jgi:hypothetical protein
MYMRTCIHTHTNIHMQVDAGGTCKPSTGEKSQHEGKAMTSSTDTAKTTKIKENVDGWVTIGGQDAVEVLHSTQPSQPKTAVKKEKTDGVSPASAAASAQHAAPRTLQAQQAPKTDSTSVPAPPQAAAKILQAPQTPRADAKKTAMTQTKTTQASAVTGSKPKSQADKSRNAVKGGAHYVSKKPQPANGEGKPETLFDKMYSYKFYIVAGVVVLAAAVAAVIVEYSTPEII